ncbi:MAG TPA: hypothetical protein VLJ21_04550, partial [Candidatus Binatia bacterium]|nr:hypothetical protein [Candidatus Binatia bacterium]
MADELVFGDKKAMHHFEPEPSAQNDMTVLNTRLRVSEERYTDLRRKLQLIEQNMLAHQKKSQSDLKTLQGDILDMKHALREMQDRIITVIKELQLTAKKEDVDVTKRYIEMWDPVRFATTEQVEKIVD